MHQINLYEFKWHRISIGKKFFFSNSIIHWKRTFYKPKFHVICISRLIPKLPHADNSSKLIMSFKFPPLSDLIFSGMRQWAIPKKACGLEAYVILLYGVLVSLELYGVAAHEYCEIGWENRTRSGECIIWHWKGRIIMGI